MCQRQSTALRPVTNEPGTFPGGGCRVSIVVQGVVRGGKVELVGGPDLAEGELVQVVIGSKSARGGPAAWPVDEGRIDTPLVDPALAQLISGIRRGRQPLPPGPTRSGRSSAAGLLAD